MLSYATIFIASTIVAVIGLFLYRVISDTSKSVLSSKGPVNIITGTQTQHKDGAVGSMSNAAFPSGHTSHATPRNMAKTFPATPIDDHPDWSVREKSSHCSLYDVNPTEQPIQKKRNAGWPQRVDKKEAGGSAYKVTRKLATDTANTDDKGKPWGW